MRTVRRRLEENIMADQQVLSIEDIANDFFDQTVCNKCSHEAVIEDLRKTEGTRNNLKDFLTVVLPAIFYVTPDDNDVEDALEEFISKDFSHGLKSLVISNQIRMKYFGRTEGKKEWTGSLPDGRGSEMEVNVYTPAIVPSYFSEKVNKALGVRIASVSGSSARWLVMFYCRLSDEELCQNVWASFTKIASLPNFTNPLQRAFHALSGEDQDDVARLISAIFSPPTPGEDKVTEAMRPYMDLHKDHREFPCAFRPEVLATYEQHQLQQSNAVEAAQQ